MMKKIALVCVKRVIDPYVQVRLKADGSGIEDHGVNKTINPFDAIALEAALRLRTSRAIDGIVAVSIGDDDSQETLRHALALGADEAILVQTKQSYPPLHIAKLLQVIVEQQKPYVVLMGKQAIDDDYNQTGQMLAARLGWPQATFVSQIDLNDAMAEVVREVDGGLETIQVQLPAVITTDLRLNEPRYATLPNIIQAKRKPLQLISEHTLDVSLKSTLKIVRYQRPPQRQPGVIVDSVAELIDKLQHEAQVLGQ